MLDVLGWCVVVIVDVECVELMEVTSQYGHMMDLYVLHRKTSLAYPSCKRTSRWSTQR